MGLDVLDNYECEGQMTIEDFLSEEVPGQIFAVSKIFAAARKQMNLPELKAFTYALTHLRFTGDNSNKILMNKRTLAAVVGVCSDSTDLSPHLKRSIGKLPKHSFIEFEDESIDFYESGMVVTGLRMYKNRVAMTINSDYMPFFSNLDKDYITMWSGDIFQMSSERSCAFYEDLRLNSDTRTTNHRGYGVKALKEMFGIPKEGRGSYVRQSGAFDREKFEKRIIDPLCADLAKCRMIKLLVLEDGKYYRKIKRNGRVLGYEFSWVVTDRPGVVDAIEARETKQAIEKNPEILKVANDIVHQKKGRKEAQKGSSRKKNSFTDFGQREYSSDELERMLLERGAD